MTTLSTVSSGLQGPDFLSRGGCHLFDTLVTLDMLVQCFYAYSGNFNHSHNLCGMWITSFKQCED